jgi:hypothetical protein
VMAKRPTPRGLPPGRGTVIKHDGPPCWRRKDACLVPRERLANVNWLVTGSGVGGRCHDGTHGDLG